MKKKNVISKVLWTLSFITLLDSHNLARASSGGCPKGYYCCEDCNDMQYECCLNNNQSSPKIAAFPKVTADDIFSSYAQGGSSNSSWKVLRVKSPTKDIKFPTSKKDLDLEFPTSAADIKVGEVTNLKDGRYRVDYAVKGIPHHAIIAPTETPAPKDSSPPQK
jgi:hypothetical protein